MSTPVTVLGGYLGAGKTTIVNALLTESHGLRIAVLVNDFGAVNVDAALIADRAARRLDLTNGCACCIVSDGLGEACLDLADADPPFDRVVIEASGVGDPAAIASWASLPGLVLDGVVVAVDPESIGRHLDDALVGHTVRGQLLAADIVVITRTDVVDDTTIERARQSVRRHTVSAPVVHSRLDAVPIAALVGVGSGDRSGSTSAHHEPDASAHGHVAASWRPDAPVDIDRLRSALASCPGLIRAKGFVRDLDGRWVLVHRAGARITLTPVTTAPASADPAAADPAITDPAITDPAITDPVIVGIGHGAEFDPATFASHLADATTP